MLRVERKPQELHQIQNYRQASMLDREDAKNYQLRLGAETPLFHEISRLLATHQSGIHLLSNGQKINATRFRLLGGVGDGVMSIAGKVMIKGIEILRDGNIKEMQNALKEQTVRAKVFLPDGKLENGTHVGSRILSNPNYAFFCCKPTYKILASGTGHFNSANLTYIGSFFENLFHDNTGKAEYLYKHEVKYVGSFSKGKKEGVGTLYKYSHERETNDFYRHYKGTWKEDSPWTGIVYNESQEIVCNYKDGTLCRIGEPISMAPPPTQDNPYRPTAPDFVPPNHQQPLTTDPFEIPPAELPVPFSFSSLTPYTPLPQEPVITPRKLVPINQNELLIKKLNNPEYNLTLEESIELLTTCIDYGREQAQKAEGKDLVIFLGNTGAGKSTTANYLSGCTMELKSFWVIFPAACCVKE